MNDGPRIPLTRRQRQVAALIGRGLSYPEIARELGLSVRTVEGYVVDMAARFDNPDDLPPYLRIFLWAGHRRWCDEHQAERTA